MRLIDIIITVEVPEEEPQSSLTILVEELENTAASIGWDVYDAKWVE